MLISAEVFHWSKITLWTTTNFRLSATWQTGQWPQWNDVTMALVRYIHLKWRYQRMDNCYRFFYWRFFEASSCLLALRFYENTKKCILELVFRGICGQYLVVFLWVDWHISAFFILGKSPTMSKAAGSLCDNRGWLEGFSSRPKRIIISISPYSPYLPQPKLERGLENVCKYAQWWLFWKLLSHYDKW